MMLRNQSDFDWDADPIVIPRGWVVLITKTIVLRPGQRIVVGAVA